MAQKTIIYAHECTAIQWLIKDLLKDFNDINLIRALSVKDFLDIVSTIQPNIIIISGELAYGDDITKRKIANGNRHQHVSGGLCLLKFLKTSNESTCKETPVFFDTMSPLLHKEPAKLLLNEKDQYTEEMENNLDIFAEFIKNTTGIKI